MFNFFCLEIKQKFLVFKKEIKSKFKINNEITWKKQFLLTKFNNFKIFKRIKFINFNHFKTIKQFEFKTKIVYSQLIKKIKTKNEFSNQQINNTFLLFNNNFIKSNKEELLKLFDLYFNGFCKVNNLKLIKTNNDLFKFLNFIDLMNLKDFEYLLLEFDYKNFWK